MKRKIKCGRGMPDKMNKTFCDLCEEEITDTIDGLYY